MGNGPDRDDWGRACNQLNGHLVEWWGGPGQGRGGTSRGSCQGRGGTGHSRKWRSGRDVCNYWDVSPRCAGVAHADACQMRKKGFVR